DGAEAGDGGAPARREPSLSLNEALRDPAFWWLALAFCLNILGGAAVNVHLVPYLTEEGFGQEFAVAAAGLIGLMALPGRLIFTPLGDRVPRSLVAAAIFMLQAVSLVVLLWSHDPVGVIAFVVLFGAGFGAITPARAALVADFYGPARYASING